jgi:hypothetical protein
MKRRAAVERSQTHRAGVFPAGANLYFNNLGGMMGRRMQQSCAQRRRPACESFCWDRLKDTIQEEPNRMIDMVLVFIAASCDER